MSLADVADALLSSGEFAARSLYDDVVLAGLYREALGRDADREELSGCLDALGTGGLTLAGVAAHVVSAPEAAALAPQLEFWA